MLKVLTPQHFVDDQWAIFPPVIKEFARTTIQNFNELSIWFDSDANYLKSNHQIVQDAQQIVHNADRMLSTGKDDLAQFKERIERQIKTIEADLAFKYTSIIERQNQLEEQLRTMKEGIDQHLKTMGDSILEGINLKIAALQEQVASKDGDPIPRAASDKIASLEKRYTELLTDLFTRSDGFTAKFDTLYKDYIQSTAAFSELTEAFKLEIASQTNLVRKCEADFFEIAQKMEAEKARIPTLTNQLEVLSDRVAVAEGKYPVIENLGFNIKSLETVMLQQDTEDKNLGNNYRDLCVKYDSMKLFLETEARSLRDGMGDCEDTMLHCCEEIRAIVAKLADSIQDLEEDLLFQINNCKSLLVGSNVYKEYEMFRKKSYDDLVTDNQRDAGFAFLSPLEMRLHRVENLLIDHMARPGHEKEKAV